MKYGIGGDRAILCWRHAVFGAICLASQRASRQQVSESAKSVNLFRSQPRFAPGQVQRVSKNRSICLGKPARFRRQQVSESSKIGQFCLASQRRFAPASQASQQNRSICLGKPAPLRASKVSEVQQKSVQFV